MKRTFRPWIWWADCAIGTFIFLWSVLNTHFKDMYWWQTLLGMGLGIGFMVVGVKRLRGLARLNEPHHDTEHEFATVGDEDELIDYIFDMGKSFTDLPDDADDARKAIDSIRGRYNAIVRSFNANTSLGGPRRVDLQMALGDYMVQVERVWSMLADGAYRQAYAVWHEASNSRHTERLRELATATN